MKAPKPTELDGRTGEGGGQLVRLAVTLASVTSQPIRITHIRAIDWLAKATGAEVEGLSIGSQTLEFRPSCGPSQLVERKIKIVADSPAASALLIFQAVFPLLLFAGDEKNQPIDLEISGGTNVSWSLSYEYLDQVLLPTLEDRFGIKVERQLKQRGWSLGSMSRGNIHFRIQPLKIGEQLRLKEPSRTDPNAKDFEVKAIDVSIVVPADMHELLTRALAKDLEMLFPDAEINFKVIDDSRNDARMYVLLVARSETLRWGRDLLYAAQRKGKSKSMLSDSISRQVCKELYEELSTGGVVDEFLQDQLVVFQALADGKTSFPRSEIPEGSPQTSSASSIVAEVEDAMAELGLTERKERLRKDKTHQPFGEGSGHTTTARWVTAELLPTVKWFNKGTICEGVGMKFDKALN
ncbi:putative rna 3 -terminal phosphate cyclase protein [Phaeoacremonium minimum UCRPA7]|uniref:Putative rna 3-terminal phosphate cyclase protein n=1 Tax=Phaeoacremonium minimum (strain UCR-PA7) TaxID=1286976 RepID=R8B9D9_PHAM7|nr:putative rna 3 -terminal phosphate cyclase protein [Phaeoacremonium minimum UCRPA7]EON95913.1 putative rna 3 -terminal phosphate cyclase protein [Phaeoacremonium minimum UCRPA7]